MQDRLYSILVVEDNPPDQYLIQEAFKERGHACSLTIASLPIQALSFDIGRWRLT